MSSAPTLMRPGILKPPSVLLGTDFSSSGGVVGGSGGQGGTVPDVASSGGSSSSASGVIHKLRWQFLRNTLQILTENISQSTAN